MDNTNVIAAAEEYWHKTSECDFILSYKLYLYRAKVSKSGKIKIKEICTGIPKLIDAKNMGTKVSPNWHYKFSIESEVHGSAEILLSTSEFSSNYTFKKSIIRQIPVLFTGNKGDFDMFIQKEINKFDFTTCHHE